MKRKLNNVSRKKDILALRKEGKTYGEIQEILGCSKSVISYHCGENSSEKKRVKKRNLSNNHKFAKKVNAYKSRCSKPAYAIFRSKVKTFKRKSHNRTHSIVNNINENFSSQDVVDKLGKNPTCYLTGEKIDLDKPDTYQFDHIIPTSKGGTNDLSNLGVCISEANFAKGDLSLNELYKLCEKILKWRDAEK
jgi:5-methylcytosine-specific restriction endonuclease McrA